MLLCLAKKVSLDSAKSKLFFVQKMVLGKERLSGFIPAALPQECVSSCPCPLVHTVFKANSQFFLYLLLWGTRLYRDQPSKGDGDDLCAVHGLAKSVLTPTSSQLLSVQGAMGTRARLWAWPQSEAHRPAEPHRSCLLPSRRLPSQHWACPSTHG